MPKHIDKDALHRAKRGAEQARKELKLSDKDYDILVIGGTGWKLPKMEKEHGETMFKKMDNAFTHLVEHPDHKRVWTFGKLHDKRCIFADGRVHMNDDPKYPQYLLPNVRAQVEVPIALGVKIIIATAAVGNITGFQPGEVCVVDDFFSFNPVTPLESGEFTSPMAALERKFQEVALSACRKVATKPFAEPGTHVFWVGPDFETEREKQAAKKLLDTAAVAGMSLRPEITVASLYSEKERGGVRCLALGYITNDEKAIPDHKAHKVQAAKDEKRNAEYLSEIIKAL